MVRAFTQQSFEEEEAEVREGVGSEQREPVFGAPAPSVLRTMASGLACCADNERVVDGVLVDVYYDLVPGLCRRSLLPS